ncbi:MAG TPA: methyltransferase [Rheinheimera sp.]|nr:methyltransferase [Rheinheimera sp.]
MSNSANAALDVKAAQFFQSLQQALSAQTLVRLVLSRYEGDDRDLVRFVARPVELKGQYMLSFVRETTTFTTTQNYLPSDAVAFVEQQLTNGFKAALLETTDSEYQLTISKKGKWLLNRTKRQGGGTPSQPAAHNREKQRFVEQSRPYLQALGVTDVQGNVIPAMQRKWKQINKFIEILAKAIRETGLAERSQVHVADFGSGKAYLTFAVFDYLTQLGLDAKVTGVELRQPLVDLCNDTAKRLGLSGLDFEQGDVQHFKARGINVMIALHACDIATDYAIHMGIQTGAEIIMCSPCCHKELRPQLQSPAVLAPLLKHGIHQGQEAEMLTDGMRALLLEASGYDTQVFEFISLEHTSKNKMILAQKRQQPRDSSAIWQQIAALKLFYGIRAQTLETLLKGGSVPTSCDSEGC